MYKVELPAVIGDKTYTFRAQLALFSGPVIFCLYIDDGKKEHPRGQLTSRNGEWVARMRPWDKWFPETRELDMCAEDVVMLIEEIEKMMPG